RQHGRGRQSPFTCRGSAPGRRLGARSSPHWPPRQRSAWRCASTNHSHLSMPRDTSVNRSAVSRSPSSLAWSMPFRARQFYDFQDSFVALATGSTIRDGYFNDRWRVFFATRVSLSARKSLPVFGLASKRGALEDDTATRMRCPLLNTSEVLHRS